MSVGHQTLQCFYLWIVKSRAFNGENLGVHNYLVIVFEDFNTNFNI